MTTTREARRLKLDPVDGVDVAFAFLPRGSCSVAELIYNTSILLILSQS